MGSFSSCFGNVLGLDFMRLDGVKTNLELPEMWRTPLQTGVTAELSQLIVVKLVANPWGLMVNQLRVVLVGRSPSRLKAGVLPPSCLTSLFRLSCRAAGALYCTQSLSEADLCTIPASSPSTSSMLWGQEAPVNAPWLSSGMYIHKKASAQAVEGVQRGGKSRSSVSALLYLPEWDAGRCQLFCPVKGNSSQWHSLGEDMPS